MNKELILEKLEGGRAYRIFELIKNSLIELYEDEDGSSMENIKEEFFDEKDYINNKINRYLLVEHYNLGDDFYFRAYAPYTEFGEMYRDYFQEDRGSNDDGCYGEILLVDMEENKCFLLDKEVKYNKKEIELNEK